MKIDSKAIEQLKRVEVKGDDPLLKLLVDLYANDSPRHLVSIKDSISVGDMPRLEHAAHILKSSSAQLGVVDLADTCRQLEEIGKGMRNLSLAPDLYERATRQFSEALEILYNLLD